MAWPFGAGQRRVLTIFSTSDYCDSGNAGAVVRFSTSEDFEKLAFDVLAEEARRKRRVLVPAWLLTRDADVEATSVCESDSQPEEGSWDGEGTVCAV
jgi:hypothetical protein